MLLNEIRELTMTDISCELLLYVSADLGIEISKKIFDAVHSCTLTKLAVCNLFSCESYCLVIVTFGVIKHPFLGSVCVCICV